jgi:putative ABC transport system permease protein
MTTPADARLALRQLRKAPGFTVAAILTLALGIGANTAMFSVVDAVLLRALPFDDPGQVVHVWEAPKPGQANSVSVGVFRDWARHATAFDAIAAVAPGELNLAGDGEPERLSGLRMSPSGLRVLRARPVVGRIFAPDEDQPGKNAVIVLTHELWTRRFGGDPGVVGRSLRLNGEPWTVIGVLPRAFLPWDGVEYVVPLVFRDAELEERGSHWLRVIGRLKPGLGPARAEADLLTVAQSYRQLYPKWKQDWGVSVRPMHEQLTREVRPMLLVLLGAVGLVLLIACANVANLLLARAAERQKEVAVRLSLGATRARIVRQLLAESLVLALAGAAAGLGLAFAATAAIRGAARTGLPRAAEIAVDWRVLGFAVLVSLATALVFGLVPALQASRPDVNAALVEGGRANTGGRSRTRHALVVAEVATALVLLAGAGLLVNSFVRLLNVPPGFDPRQTIALQLTMSGRGYPDPATRAAVMERILERVRSVPGVEAAGSVTTLPLTWPMDTLVRLAGREGPHDGRFSSDFDYVDGESFRALGIPLMRGRLFDTRDAAAQAKVAVVNEAFALTLFPGRDPLGQFIGEGQEQWQIVGVVGDVRVRGLGEAIRPLFYRPLAFGWFPGRRLVVRTAGPPHAFVEPIRRAILAVEPELPVANPQSLEELVAASVGQRRLVLAVLGFFAASALLLAGVGLYGVVACTVSQRTREIGIRMAVGAPRRAVVGLFLRQGARLTGLGIALGLLGGAALTRLLASQLYGVKATDPLTFAAVSAVLLLVALAASFLPARRAAAVDPVNALR